VSGGLESMATDIAERNGIPLRDARELLARVNLESASDAAPEADSYETHVSYEAPVSEEAIDARPVLASGIREIAGEVRNSLDFHRSQDGGGEVSSVVLSGPALQISGFSSALQNELRVPVIPQTVGLLDEGSAGSVSAEHLAVAAGLAAGEAPR